MEPTAEGKIAGKICANPNPIPADNTQGTVINWETNDPVGAEVLVAIPGSPRKLFSRGKRGAVTVPWITAANPCRFELFGLTQRELLLDQIVVEREANSALRRMDLLSTDKQGETSSLEQLASLVANAGPRCVQSARFPEFFRLWQECGIHVTPVHFYQPIPDTRALPESLWTRPSQMPGIDLNEKFQLELLSNCFPKFRHEYEAFPVRSSIDGRLSLLNGQFDGTDALVAYCMVRHFQPQTMIEVGSGYSSLFLGQASVMNGSSCLTCIEPFPRDFLLREVPGVQQLIQKQVETFEPEFFTSLSSGDILFIDSSHTVKIGGDVTFLFLEVLPRLNPGVIVHVHDIFFPFAYRRDWVVDQLRFWTEQYLLQAFLAFNSSFEVLLCNNYLAHFHLNELKTTFPHSPWWGGGSFWMRRK